MSGDSQHPQHALLRLSGEVGTKARATRRQFRDRLAANVRDALATLPREASLQVEHDRLYVRLAEGVNGAIEQPVSWDYIWGDALSELANRKPHARIVNLETSITLSDEPWPGKSVHYRMHPANARCLRPAALSRQSRLSTARRARGTGNPGVAVALAPSRSLAASAGQIGESGKGRGA